MTSGSETYHTSLVVREFFLLQSYPKNSNPSLYETDLDLLGFFRKGTTHIIANFHRTDLVIFSHSRERKSQFYSQPNKYGIIAALVP